MDETTITLIVAVSSSCAAMVGAGFTVAVAYLGNRHARQLKELEWKREKELNEIEEKKKEKSQSLERAKEIRQELEEQYSNAIAHISKLIKLIGRDTTTHTTNRDKEKAISEAFMESSKWLTLILMFYPDKESKDYRDLHNHFTGMSYDDFNSLDMLRDTILRTGRNDPRLINSTDEPTD